MASRKSQSVQGAPKAEGDERVCVEEHDLCCTFWVIFRSLDPFFPLNVSSFWSYFLMPGTDWETNVLVMSVQAPLIDIRGGVLAGRWVGIYIRPPRLLDSPNIPTPLTRSPPRSNPGGLHYPSPFPNPREQAPFSHCNIRNGTGGSLKRLGVQRQGAAGMSHAARTFALRLARTLVYI